jgi:hypothetical protein
MVDCWTRGTVDSVILDSFLSPGSTSYGYKGYKHGLVNYVFLSHVQNITCVLTFSFDERKHSVNLAVLSS